MIDSNPELTLPRMDRMNIRHLRYFVAVAEALSFAKAARELHMSQPPLSKRIAEMEEVLGVRLFDRSSKSVTLTATGQALLPRAREAVRAFDAAVRVARSLTPAAARPLRIATPVETSRTVLLDIVSKLHREGLEVDMSEASTPEQERLLAESEIDIGVFRYPIDLHGLKISAPLAQPLGVLMGSGHPLAKRESLQLTELQPYPLALFHRHMHPGLHDEWLERCRSHGYVPPKILYGAKLMLMLLVNENAVTFVREKLLMRRGQSGTGELVWRPLEGSPILWWTSAMCRAQDWNPSTRLAMNVISQSLQEREQWVPMARPEGKPCTGRRRAKSEPSFD
ncbi:MAG: LysR family transcriptional regulator [Rubrivivax sp.]